MPHKSSVAIIDEYLARQNIQQHKIERLNILKNEILLRKEEYSKPFPLLSEFVLNHPLYKTRQSVIERNVAILKEQKKLTELDETLLDAVKKLGEVRSVEAVEVLTPYLLLKTKPELKLTDKKTNEKKFFSLQNCPVAVSLVQIGIPSIWGLLNEIAANHHDEPYYQTAYQTMTAILPDVAIPGFVNELLKTKQDEMSQLRLYNMYPLMGLPIEGTPLIPQLREWQSTDGLFKTTAKFIALEKNDVVLEKHDGKRTTIELNVLRKTDQDYVKTQIATVEKTVKKNNNIKPKETN
jgi:hypothetical protein